MPPREARGPALPPREARGPARKARRPALTGPRAEIGVIGGSGFYRFLEDVSEVRVPTPYGAPSSPVALGRVEGRAVAFVARHGVDHTLAPHGVNYRANLWALRRLGVSRVVGPCAAGSLRADMRQGDLVVCDQLVDRTRGRADTFVDGPVVSHAAFADPYCPELGAVLAAAGEGLGLTVHRGATVVVVQGPRFSTRAESAWFRAAGWDLVNMTQYPEAALARELGICYAGLALVTDHDAGLGEDGVAPVTMAAVLDVLAANVDKARRLLTAAIPAVPEARSCKCAAAGAAGWAFPPLS
ncbi:MAG: S-methyl-5'-thioadenosine phosphorylase [Acidimicrobiales bacterium]